MTATHGLSGGPGPNRLAILDGWRAISILLVLACHMLDLGSKPWDLNETSGYMGMSLFFTLSGFLITCQLDQRHNVLTFFIRRLFRILPLAYLAILVRASIAGADVSQIVINLLFAETYMERGLIRGLGHFWSLCVEVHFYLFIGLLMSITRFRGFMVIPFVWAAVVVARFLTDRTGGRIHTHMRVDEILSGCLLAMLFLGKFGERAKNIVARLPVVLPLLFLVIACHPSLHRLHAFRGLAASTLVGHTLLSVHQARYSLLGIRPLRYLAEISYALYVVHPFTTRGWMGQGATPTVKYAKLIACFAITFLAAHISTFYFEHRFSQWAKALCKRIESAPAPRTPVAPA